MTWKISLLVIFELLLLFFKTLTADDKYPLCNIWNLPQVIQMLLSKKVKNVLNFFLHFSNIYQILQILKKKMTLIAYVGSKFQTVKSMVRQISK